MTASLEFCDVWKEYKTGLTVLRGLALTLFSGEIVLLVGENGAGKTTAFDIACGNRRPDRGEVRVHGIPITRRPPEDLARMGVRRMYQSPTVFRSLPIRDNILLAVQPTTYAAFRPWPFESQRARLWGEVQDLAARLFTVCPFLHRWRTLAGELSYGQQRVVDFLRVVASRPSPKVALFDEPFAGIHSEVAEVMWTMLRDLASTGTTIVVIEHENEVLRFNGVRRLRLIGGRLQ